MVRVGFIDYFLDEWHANNYPKMLDEHSKGRYSVTLAYGMIDNPHGGMTNEQWSQTYDIPLAETDGNTAVDTPTAYLCFLLLPSQRRL